MFLIYMMIVPVFKGTILIALFIQNLWFSSYDRTNKQIDTQTEIITLYKLLAEMAGVALEFLNQILKIKNLFWRKKSISIFGKKILIL